MNLSTARTKSEITARSTRQKSAIRAAFETAARPLGAAEVLSIASEHAETLGIATVYRNIKSLLNEGWLRQVELPGQAPRYEFRNGGTRHSHFHCTGCGKVYTVGHCEVNTKRVLPRGFKLAGHTMVLHGQCSACNR
jgi:Fur family ferric uptake transcriptional regulator